MHELPQVRWRGTVNAASARALDKAAVSTGHTIHLSLTEKLAMEEVKANSLGVTPPPMPKRIGAVLLQGTVLLTRPGPLPADRSRGISKRS